MQVLPAVALLALTLLAAPIAHGQKTGLQENAKCPIKDRKRYEGVINNNKAPQWYSEPPNKAWFTAPTTSALHQAAYVFDTPRVECLLTVAKMDPNLVVPFKGATDPLPPQWPLGAALTHLDELYNTEKVTDDMIATIRALLKAGANPNVGFYNRNKTPLALISWLTCDNNPPGNCLMAPGVLTIAKALVSAGAKPDAVEQGGFTPSSNLVYGIGSVHCEDDTVYKQFMEYLVSQGADAESAIGGADQFGEQICPPLFQWLRKAAAAQKAKKAAQKTSKEAAAQKKG